MRNGKCYRYYTFHYKMFGIARDATTFITLTLKLMYHQLPKHILNIHLLSS